MLTHKDVLRRGASSYGHRVAFHGPDGGQWTYSELDEVTNRIANSLLARGLEPGDRLLWIDQNSAEYMLAYYATAKAGLTLSPMNYWLRADELRPLASLVAPAAVVAGSDYVESISEAVDVNRAEMRFVLDGDPPEGWEAWAPLQDGGAEDPAPDVAESTIHEIIFTSGTTGQAKGVKRTQRARILDSMNAALAYELTRNDHMLWFLPQFHIGGGSVPNQMIIQGGTVSILRKFDADLAAAAIPRGITYIVGVPAHYNLMFESGALEDMDTSSVRGCYVGGSVASRHVFERIQKQFPNADLVHGYGSTESGPHTMALRGQDFLDHFGALGLPVPGTEVRVVDPEGEEDVSTGEVGELWVRSDSVMEGYLDRPDLTESAFAPGGWLRTGDLVRQDEDGYFHLVDRAKDMIITGGENVYSSEVEDVLSAHPAVEEAAVIGVPDPIYEERVVALVRLGTDGPEDLSEDQLITFVRERLAGFKTPKEIHFLEEFPRTGVGKIAKHELRDQYGSVFGTEEDGQ